MSAVQNGTMVLWSSENAAAITEISDYPLKRVLVVSLAGGDMSEIKGLEDRAAVYGKYLGCSEIHIHGRKGWLKALPEYELEAVTLSKKI